MSDPVTPAAEASEPGGEQYRAAVRRAPKLAVFLGLGGVLGAIVAFILTAVHGAGSTQPDGSAISDNGLWIAVVFFFSIGIGVAVGAIVALILDRASHRRVAIVTVERGVVEAEPAEDEDGAGEAEPAGAAGEAEPAVVAEAEPVNADTAAGSEVTENSSPDVGGRV